MARKSVTITAINLQAGTERTIFVTWSFSAQHLDNYRVVWEYNTGQGIWFTGNDSTTSGNSSTYSAPTNAIQGGVRATVTPVAKKYTSGKNKGKPYWNGVGATATYTGTYADKPDNTIPAAPSNVTVEIDGTTVTAKVTNYSDALSNGLITFQIVQDGNAAIGGEPSAWNNYGVASVSVTGSLGGHRYKARAKAWGKNNEQSAWSSYSNEVITVPPKATIAKATATASDAVSISWNVLAGAASYTVGYTKTVDPDGKPVWDSASGGQEATDIHGTFALISSLETGKKWYFRLKGVNDGGSGEWSDPVERMLGTTPDKPTIWSYTTVGKIGTPIIFNWVHSSEDASEQSGAVIGYKINDGDEQTIGTTSNPVITTDQFYSFDTSSLTDGAKIKWRVRTRGTQDIPDEWGEYSEYREVVVYTPPSITFSVGVADPEETHPVIKQFPIDLGISALPTTQTPVAYYISITSDESYDISQADGIEIHVSTNQEIYSTVHLTSELSFHYYISPGEIYLHSGTTYTATISVAMTNGLSAEASNKFVAKWDDSSWDPDADIDIDSDTLTAMVRPFVADQWGFEYKKNIMLAVYRIDFDGNLTEVASRIDPGDNTTVCDMHPSLDYARYRIVATDLRTGVVSFSDLPGVPVNEPSAVIQWEGEMRRLALSREDLNETINNWSGTILKLPYNIDVSDTISPDVSLVEYIGRKHPVSYYGTQQGSTSNWTVTVPKSDTATIAKIRALAIYPGDVYVREPYGTGYWANVKVSYNITHDKAAFNATFAISRVEGGA